MSFNDLYLEKVLIKDKICSQKMKAWAVIPTRASLNRKLEFCRRIVSSEFHWMQLQYRDVRLLELKKY